MSPTPGWLAGADARDGTAFATRPLPTFAADLAGIVGDHSTDNTSAINAEIGRVSALGGGVIAFPPGIYMASQIALKSGVILDGGSYLAVTLRQIAGSNQDFIRSEDFASVTGQTGVVVPHFFGLRDIRIDGNKANNASGRGIAWCGSGQLMLGIVAVQNCAGHNIYTECPNAYTSPTLPTFDDFVEGHFQTVLSLFPGDRGWHFVGPTDSTIQEYICVLDADSEYGWYSENTATASGVVDWAGSMHVYPFGASTARLGFFIDSILHADTIIADGVTCVVASASVIRTVSLFLIGHTGLNGLTVSANDTSIGAVHGAFSSAATNSIAINWTGSRGSLGRALVSGAGASTGNTGLKNTGGSNFFSHLYILDLSAAGGIGIDEGNVGANTFHGTVVNCKTAWTYSASGGFERVHLFVYTNAGQTGVAGSTPGTTDRFDIRELGLQSAGTDVFVASSNAIAMDSTALQTVTLAHTCLYTPVARTVVLSFSTPTVTDFVWAIPPYFVSADATNLTIKCKLSTASATGGSKGDVTAHIRMGA